MLEILKIESGSEQYRRKNSVSLAFLLVTLVSAQVSLTPLPSQAQTATARIEGNCGFTRPFTKATTTWSGGTANTFAYADASLYRWNGFDYVEIAYQQSEKFGNSGTAAADAGVSYAKGWFEGETAHDFSFWSGPRSYITGEFRCQ